MPDQAYGQGGDGFVILERRRSTLMPCAREAETDIVVAIAGIVPVAIRTTQVPRFVVPGTAPFDTVRTRSTPDPYRILNDRY